jgi:hypothetical protein
MNTLLAFLLHLTLIILGAICLGNGLSHAIHETKKITMIIWFATGTTLLYMAYRFGEQFEPQIKNAISTEVQKITR